MVEELLSRHAKVENDNVLITVAMPIYNAGPYLRLAVLSILYQSFQHWELLIIDDGSTDNSLDSIIDVDDPRVRVLRDGHNRGLAVRLNEACDIARGRYVARMDQDDVSYSERLLVQFEMLENNPDIDVLATRAVLIDEQNHLKGLFPHASTHAEICARPWLGFYFPHPTWMAKTTWLRKFRYATPAAFLSEDYELLLRSYQYSQFRTTDVILLAYRKRSTVNHGRLARTRFAVLQAQLRVFILMGMPGLAALSALTFCFKNIGDGFRRFGISSHALPVPMPEAGKWADTLARLLAKSEVKGRF